MSWILLKSTENKRPSMPRVPRLVSTSSASSYVLALLARFSLLILLLCVFVLLLRLLALLAPSCRTPSLDVLRPELALLLDVGFEMCLGCICRVVVFQFFRVSYDLMSAFSSGWSLNFVAPPEKRGQNGAVVFRTTGNDLRRSTGS